MKTLLKTLYPKESQDYRWADIEFINNKPSSKFEVAKKLTLGFNGDRLITFGYRQLVIEDKSMFIGSIGSDEAKGKEAEELFGQISGGTTSRCFDEIKIIRSMTGEKESDRFDPCSITFQTVSPR